MERKSLTYLFLIVILGALLRFSYLVYSPPSLNWDEVSHGYNAYSILKTGVDQWGQKFPMINFRAYGDYPAPLNLYLTIPFVIIFGLSEFAIRFPHAILGVLTIISVYFLAWGITKKENLSLLASLLVAIDPWNLFTSRFVLQSNLSVFFLITAGAFFVNRVKGKHFLKISLFSLFLTLFSYHTTRIFSPLILVGALLIYRDEIKNKLVYVFATLFLVISIFILVNPTSRARGNLLFLIDQGAINRIIGQRNSSKLPEGIKRLIYNRPVYFVEQFSKNYISYFSPQFLFLSGGTQYQFSIPGKGLIYPVNLAFFYIGLVTLIFMSRKEKNFQFLLLWLLLSPIPASLTNESAAVIRATTMLPVPEILISIGFFWTLEKIGKNYKWLFIASYVVILYVLLESYLVNYFTAYRTDYSYAWQYGYKEAVNYAKENYEKYDKIIVTKKYGEPHEYFLFFLSYDPAKYLSDEDKIAFFQSSWYWVDKFDKFYFVNDWQVKDLKLESGGSIDCKKSKCLLITSQGNKPIDWKKLKTIDFVSGKPAFEIYEN